MLLVDGTIWTVGSNRYGQLGTGDIYEGRDDLEALDGYGFGLTHSSTFVQVALSAESVDAAGRPIASEGIASINQILGRGYNFAVITEGKEAYLWGDNSSHQLGAEEWVQNRYRFNDIELPGMPVGDYTDRILSYNHSYAAQPVKLQTSNEEGGTLQNVINVTFGGYVGGTVQALAVTMEEEYDYTAGLETLSNREFYTWAWGSNSYNKAGQTGSSDTTRAQKIGIFEEEGESILAEGVQFQALAAGGNHSAAFDTNGIVYTWGSNEYGQLGNFDYTYDKHSTEEPDKNDKDAHFKWEAEVSEHKPQQVDEEHIAIFEVINTTSGTTTNCPS